MTAAEAAAAVAAAAAGSTDTSVTVEAILSPPSYATLTGSTSTNLLLDSQIRDWVVLPLLVIMIAAGLLRHHLGLILRTNRKPISHVETQTRSCLQRCNRLRSGAGGYLSRSKWEGRRRYYCSRDSGYLREESARITKAKESGEIHDPAMDDALNPMAMMDGVKGNMVFMVQNMVMMQGISHFFSGFVLVKVPFPLTNGFKQMFQRGLGLTTLDTSYVSSVSWYFLVMFGLRGFFRLVIGDPTQETQESMAVQHGMGASTQGAPPQKFQAEQALKQEADNMELIRQAHSMLEDDAERKLLGRKYPKKRMFAARNKGGGGANAGDDIFGYGAAPTSPSKGNKGGSSSGKKNK